MKKVLLSLTLLGFVYSVQAQDVKKKAPVDQNTELSQQQKQNQNATQPQQAQPLSNTTQNQPNAVMQPDTTKKKGDTTKVAPENPVK
ncbi:MAG TPA: hypothetical protein VN721_07930 [Flavipsychrobacter sp.]|nr:hypothetical protein [Flavipsychrobacter sp.]